MLSTMVSGYGALRARLEGLGSDMSLFGLRLIMAYEFGEAGLEKLRGENWFSHVQEQFPVPFNLVSADVSWFLATWTELIAAVLLLLGLATRFSAFALLVLTGVAIASVHWPDSWSSLSELWQGYAITDKGQGNFKLPLLFAMMLWPLVFIGPGHLSLDALLVRILPKGAAPSRTAGHDALAAALVLLVFGLPLAQVLPAFGYGLTVLGLLLAGIGLYALRDREPISPTLAMEG
jgi:putative oxidoreductase